MLNIDSQNRRRHSRIGLSGIEARLKSPLGKVFIGRTRDVSHSGAFILCNDPVFIASSKTCLLKLIFSEHGAPREVGFKCRCIRTDATGFAVEFISIRQGDNDFFSKMLENSSGEGEKIRGEYKKCPYPPEGAFE